VRELIIIMGVAGSGKSSIAEALSEAEGWPFVEADVHHSAANKEKMASGTPLTDADRADWVCSMGETVAEMPDSRVVLACSALTPFVQTALRQQSDRRCLFVLLDVPKAELARRISARGDHFMPVSLLDSQLASLQPPADVIRVDGTAKPAALVDDIRARLTET
jgi:gluconokinase